METIQNQSPFIMLDLDYPNESSPAVLVDYVYEKHPELFSMPPHSHDFYELFICKNSSGSHSINFEDFPIKQNRVYILCPGHIHFLDDKKIEGYALIFKKDFYRENNFLFHFLLPDSFIKFIDLKDNERLAVKYLLELIMLEQAKPTPNFTIIKNHIYSIFVEINNEYNKSHNSENLSMVFAFLDALDKNFIAHKTVEFYAKGLNCSEKTLNNNIKACTGKSPKSFINNKIIAEAKRMLISQAVPVNYIAYNLGFEDASYFGRFFRNQTGHTPYQYKKLKLENQPS